MSPLEQSLRLLLELHTAMEAEDTKAADDLREKMDAPHWGMSEEERWLISLVSETLYGDETAKAHLASVHRKVTCP